MNLTHEQEQLLIIKGMVASLPPELSKQVIELAESLRQSIEKAGDVVGPLAIALVGAELSAKE